MGAEGGMWAKVQEKFRRKSPAEKAEAQLKNLDQQEQAENAQHTETIEAEKARYKAVMEKITGAREKLSAVVESGKLDKVIATLTANGRVLNEKLSKALTAYKTIKGLVESTIKAVTDNPEAAKATVESLRQVLVAPLEAQKEPIVIAMREALEKKAQLDAIIKGIQPEAQAA